MRRLRSREIKVEEGKLWRRENKNEEEMGKYQNCREGGNSRMRRENNTILLIILLEEGIKEEKIEEGK